MWERRPLPSLLHMTEVSQQPGRWATPGTGTTSHRRECPPGHFWSSTEADRLRSHLPVIRVSGMSLLDHEDTSTWDLMADWVQPFSAGGYTTGVVGVRCSSLSELDRQKSVNCHVLLMIPGPQEPECPDIHITRTAHIFLANGPLNNAQPVLPSTAAITGLKVSYTVPSSGKEVDITTPMYLTGFLADSPARVKFSKSNVLGAYVCCPSCTFTGASFQGEKTTTIYYKGYNQPAEQYRYVTVGLCCPACV